MAPTSVKERVLEFLAEYDERGYAVLRAAIAAYTYSKGKPGVRLGDFSFREVVQRLKAWGLDYNPSMLLRILERDYGVLETSYKSSSQHWFKFADVEAVVEALEEYEKGSRVDTEGDGGQEGEELSGDPEALLLKVQAASLDLAGVEEKLRRLVLKPRLTSSDIALFRSIAFNELEKMVLLLKKAESIGYEGEEVEAIKRILQLSLRLAEKIARSSRLEATAREAVMELARMLQLEDTRSADARPKP